MNVRYLIEMLEAMNEERVAWCFDERPDTDLPQKFVSDNVVHLIAPWR
jgi:hypothetical protein